MENETRTDVYDSHICDFPVDPDCLDADAHNERHNQHIYNI